MKSAILAAIASIIFALSACGSNETPPPPQDCDATLCVSQAKYDCLETTGTMTVEVSKAKKDDTEVSYTVAIAVNDDVAIATFGLLTKDKPSSSPQAGPSTTSDITILSEGGMTITRLFDFAVDCR